MQTSSVSIGVLRERHRGERRVALVPADVKRIASRLSVCVEEDAGSQAGITDRDYAKAGATVADHDTVVSRCDVLVKVRAPEPSDALRPDTLLISLGSRDERVIRNLAALGIRHLALERIPRTTLAQSMDALSSQAAVAGYAAVLEGARWLDTMLPMMTTAAGTIRPSKMMAIGTGVAGLQAIATARRLGAQVYGFDVRAAAREQVESLGATFVSLEDLPSAAETAAGYAAAQTDDQQQRIRGALTKHLSSMRLVVCSAQVPGHQAPLLIDDVTIAAMSPGSVIVDLAAESGGNTTLTRPDETVSVAGVHILGPTNLPSTIAADASFLFSGNIRALLLHLLNADNQLSLNAVDPIVAALVDHQPARLVSGHSA